MKEYIQRWEGYFSFTSNNNRPMVVVSYFRNDEYNLVNAFKEVCNQHNTLDCIFSKTLHQIPINTLKNTGIQAVKTSHFFVIDCNLVPTSILFFF